MLNLATIFVYIDGVCSQVHINQLYKHMWHTFTIFFFFILAYLFAIKNLTENLGYREWVSLRIRLILSKGIFNFVKNLKIQQNSWQMTGSIHGFTKFQCQIRKVYTSSNQSEWELVLNLLLLVSSKQSDSV